MTGIAHRSAARLAAAIAPLCLAVLAGAGCERPSGSPVPEEATPEGAVRAAAPAAQSAPKPAVITTSSGVEMVAVPAGKLLMGDAAGEADEKPPREVEVSAFLIDRFEVTQERFEKATGYNPAKRERKDDAVDRVRWTEAIDYSNQRSKLEGLEPCYDLKTGECRFEASGYRLPTEAEWEYACRAGTTTRYFSGDDAGSIELFAWFDRNAPKDSRPAGAKQANPWGLHDMAGSLLEWCNDFYAPDAYATRPPREGDTGAAKDPVGPAAGKERVLRGGCWSMGPEKCRSAIRFHDEPSSADSCFGWESYGFRCVRRAPAGQGGAHP